MYHVDNLLHTHTSPSLFHRPSTPQLCSTQFEWTIDDVSSLNPANVEAHETQFMSTTDPETEAKAQAAINSYFKEQIVLPSPIDCVLRNQKIILKDDTFVSMTAADKSTRDGCCQTELTFPPILPKSVEDILRPYFTYTMDQQQIHVITCDKTNATLDAEIRDASLRRKLFETSLSSTDSDNFQHIELADDLSPPPKSPELINVEVKCFLIRLKPVFYLFLFFFRTVTTRKPETLVHQIACNMNRLTFP